MSYVLPKRGFNDTKEIWGRNKLLIDSSLKKDGGKEKYINKYSNEGVDFYQLNGPITSSVLAVNDSVCTPIQTSVAMDKNKKDVLTFWAYPNGEFSPITEIAHTTHAQPYGASNTGNPNGGTDVITLQPSQITIPPISLQVSEPNKDKKYADYRNTKLSSNETNWTFPQYYRSSYQASDMECAISTKPFVTTKSGAKGDFPFLQFPNGYKLLDDGVTVAPMTDNRTGEQLYVTCNPGIFPKDASSPEYIKIMSAYCGSGNESFYKDSQYSANPNYNRQDSDGNPLGQGTLERFNSNLCQNFCTINPVACKKPFEAWCSKIENWSPQGTCYATANIVRSTIPLEQNAVVPTLLSLCQNENLDTDVCKTFCFANNTSSLNCEGALKNYCGKLVQNELSNMGSLFIGDTSNSVDSSYNGNVFTTTISSPFNVSDAVLLTDTKNGSSITMSDYENIKFEGYVEDSMLFVTNPIGGIPLVLHKMLPTDKTYPTVYASPLVDSSKVIQFQINGTTYIAFLFLIQTADTPSVVFGKNQNDCTMSELLISGDSNQTTAYKNLNGVYKVYNFSSLGGIYVNYTVCIQKNYFTGTPPDPGGHTYISALQPLIFSKNLYGEITPNAQKLLQYIPVYPDVGNVYTKIPIDHFINLNYGNSDFPVNFEINKFFSSYQGDSDTTALFALTPARAEEGLHYTFVFQDGSTTVTTKLQNPDNSVTTISNPGPSPLSIRNTPDGQFVTYSNDIVQQAAENVYASHEQCPCFMPTWVYNHYYDDLFAEFPNSAPLQAFIETISTKPICNYPQCATNINGTTTYIPRENPTCPNVVQCLQNAQISIEKIGYLAKTNFQVHDSDSDLICKQKLSTFSVFEDTGLFGVLDPTKSFYDILYQGTGIITMKVFRASVAGAGNSNPVIPPIISSFFGYIINNTLIATRKSNTAGGQYPPPNFSSVTGESHTLIAQGIKPFTFLLGDPQPFGGTGSGMYVYTLGGGNYSSGDSLGSSSNQLLFTLQADMPTNLNTYPISSSTPGVPTIPNYYVQNTAKTVQKVNYKIGDAVHVYETNRWRNFDSTLPTFFKGYISNPNSGNSVLHVVSTSGPIGPGLLQSINNVLPNTRIMELLTGNGKPFDGASTWSLNTRYPSTLGSETSPINMYISPESVFRWFHGIIKEIYPETGTDYYFMTVNMLDTNEAENQNKWSYSTTYVTQNSMGQRAECLSIGFDGDDTQLPSGEEISSSTWEDVYDFDRPSVLITEEFFPRESVKTTGSIVLVVIIIIVVLILIIIVSGILYRRKNQEMSDMSDMLKSKDTDGEASSGELNTLSSTPDISGSNSNLDSTPSK